jgi:very-short-patch-repair endonuclease
MGQVRDCGLSHHVVARLLREGRWRRISHGVYALTDENWLQLAWAGLLIGGPGTVLGGYSAAYLHHLIDHAPRRIDIYLGPKWASRTDPRWNFIQGARVGKGDPPRTTVAQTVVDLGQGLKLDQLAALVARAESEHRIHPETILRQLRGTPRHRQRALLTEILTDTAAGATGALEHHYLRLVERAHGLPTAVRQATPVGPYRCDVWYEKYGVIVELDGQAFHRGIAANTDVTRDYVHQLHNLMTLRFTWPQVVHDPCRVANRVTTALALGGWTGQVKSCPRCHLADDLT